LSRFASERAPEGQVQTTLKGLTAVGRRQVNSMKNSCRVELERLHEAVRAAGGVFDGPVVATPNLDLLVQRPRVGVGCVLLSPDLYPDCLLIGERQGSHGAGHWALPGGHLEQNESFAQCANKEVLEECVIDVPCSEWGMLYTSNDPMPEEDRHYVTIFQIARISEVQTRDISNGEPTKCRGWEWVPFSDISNKKSFIPLKNFLLAGGIEMIRNSKAYSSSTNH